MATLESLVGLQPLKDYCRAVRRDCLARAALGDPPLVRNVLVSGSLGTGKKLAAEMLTALLRALGVAKGMQPTRTTLRLRGRQREPGRSSGRARRCAPSG